MEADRASSLGLSGRVGEDPDDSDYEDVEELFEERVEAVEGVEGEVVLKGEVGEVAEKEAGAEEVKEVAEKVGGEEVAKKDDEPLAPKAEVADDGTKKSEDSGSAIKHISSVLQKSEVNLLSSSQKKSLKKCSQARNSFQSKCIISSKKSVLPNSKVVTRNIGETKSVKNVRRDEASYSKAHVVLRNKNPDGAVQPLDKLNKTNCQTPKCFDAPSARIVPRRPRSSPLGVDETALKKPAIICDFFVKGWCIKGNSCRFLHVKDGAAVAGSMRQDGKSKQPTTYELLHSGSDESLKDPSVRQRALVRAFGVESHDLTETSSEYCQGTLGTRSYDNFDFNRCSFNEEYQNRQNLKEGASYQEVLRGDTHDAPFSSAFRDRNYPFGESSIISDLHHSGSINYSNGNNQADWGAGYEQYHYPPYEYRSYSLSSMDSSYNNPHSYLHSAPSVHAFSQPIRPIHNSTILGSEHDSIQRIDCDREYYGSSHVPRISPPYYSKPDYLNSEKGISEDTTPSVEPKSALLEHPWQTSVPFRSSFCSTNLDKTFPDGHPDPPVDGAEPPKIVTTSDMSIDHSKIDEYVTDGISSENFTSGHGELKPTEVFSSRTYKDVRDKTSPHGVGSYPSMLSASHNGSIVEVEISMPDNERHQIRHPHDDLSFKEKEIGTRVRNEADKGSNNMEPRALRIFRVALVNFVKELVKPAWKDGHISKDAHKIVVKKSVEKILSTLQLHEIPSEGESTNSFLSTSHPKILKLVEAYMAKYATLSNAGGFKPL